MFRWLFPYAVVGPSNLVLSPCPARSSSPDWLGSRIGDLKLQYVSSLVGIRSRSNLDYVSQVYCQIQHIRFRLNKQSRLFASWWITVHLLLTSNSWATLLVPI